MDTPLTITAAFLLGVFGTVHCIGMCGGIIGALSLSLPQTIRAHRPRLLLFVTTYNIGRVLSYTLAGLIAGTIGAELFSAMGLSQGHKVLQIIGISMMIAIGLYLAGWLPQLALIEKIGAPLWKRLEPVARRLMPVDTLPKALFYGTLWGWLPCGLVYYVLVWALTSGGAIEGASMMLAFGAGTLPGLIATGAMASWITRFAQSPNTRRIVGVLIILMAVATLFVPMGGGTGGDTGDHSGHAHHH